jgi:hypothetical protein
VRALAAASATRAARAACCGIGCGLLAIVALGQAQTKPPLRVLKPGSSAMFGVQLRIRSEVAGQKTTTIATKTYVQPVSQWVEQKVAWQATRRVGTAASDGSVEIQEDLGGFSHAESSSEDSADTHKLLDELAAAVNPWENPRTLRYRETAGGQISGLTADSAPPLGEPAPRILTAWLARALRPTAALPAHSLVFNQMWQEPRSVQLAEWSNATGSESGEWLEEGSNARSRGEAAIQLLATQDISGDVAAGSEKPKEGSATAHFHGESLSALSNDDLRLLSATRSATREIVWTLAPVDGLAKPPEFRARLLVEIRIQVCNESLCDNAPGSGVGR